MSFFLEDAHERIELDLRFGHGIGPREVPVCDHDGLLFFIGGLEPNVAEQQARSISSTQLPQGCGQHHH